jgi:catechol 2,3-dioxygenase-like lactoylglutathione lyase family enzyme
METGMVRNFDHLAIVVHDIDRARRFFGLLGFKEAITTVISGKTFADYMGVPDIEADHITLVLEHATPRTEIQLLHYRHPDAVPDPHIRDLNKLGMNHVCFAVDDIDAEVAKQRANGFQTRTGVLDYHSRKIVLVEGPEGVTVELAQWDGDARRAGTSS